jgi:hypothetical protein
MKHANIDNRLMSNGAVAFKEGLGWFGLHHIGDPTPSILGAQVWRHLQEDIHYLKSIRKRLLAYKSWDEYINDGLCPYCGKYDKGMPVAIHPELYSKTNQIGLYLPDPEATDSKTTLATDPEAKQHKHIKHRNLISADNAKEDGVFIEWVYVIDPLSYELNILKSVRGEGTHVQSVFGGMKLYNYQYISVRKCELLRKEQSWEPDWEEIEEKGKKLATGFYHKYTRQAK